ncbi:hypothetical protein D1872_251260 [compost metagenome]
MKAAEVLGCRREHAPVLKAFIAVSHDEQRGIFVSFLSRKPGALERMTVFQRDLKIDRHRNPSFHQKKVCSTFLIIPYSFPGTVR